MLRFQTHFLVFFLTTMAVSFSKAQSEARDLSSADKQILINGRLWENDYARIKGDPFLFSREFLPGSIVINNIHFSKLLLRYDIYADEIMMPFDHGILQLNKELVDSFSIFQDNQNFNFVKIPDKPGYPISGYVRDLYSDNSALYVKYQKKIDRPGMVNAPDNFYMVRKMYYVRDSVFSPVRSRRDLLRIFGKDKEQIIAFMRNNKIHVHRNKPESFVPVIRYRDTISQRSSL